MRLICVSTGSQDGNSYLLQLNDGKYILLDCGAKYNDIKKRCDYNPGNILFAIYTHKHKDHFKPETVKELKRAGIYVFSVKPNTKYKTSYITVNSFPVQHTNNDSTDCPNNAYIIEYCGERLLYMTDWMYCKYDLSKFKINHFLIAVNYTDLEEDEVGKMDHVARGHSSLDTAKEFLKTSITDSCRNIIVCHLSSKNADEGRIIRELTEIVPETVNVSIARKGYTFELL